MDVSRASDPALAEAIRRTQAGEVEAFAAVVEAFQRPLRTWLSRDCVPGIDPDEVAQRAFITAFTLIHEFAPGSNCFAWLCAIARNHLRDEHKRLRRDRAVPIDALHELAGIELAQAGDGGDERLLAALRACLGRLPAVMAELVELRYTRQIPLGDIAATLGTSLGAVKVRLHHLRGKLHDCMQARLGGVP